MSSNSNSSASALSSSTSTSTSSASSSSSHQKKNSNASPVNATNSSNSTTQPAAVAASAATATAPATNAASTPVNSHSSSGLNGNQSESNGKWVILNRQPSSSLTSPSNSLSTPSSAAMKKSPSGDNLRSQPADVEAFKNKVEAQAHRRQQFQTESQLMAATVERENAFWAAQEDKNAAVVARMQLADRTVRDLHKHLMKSSKILSSLSDLLNEQAAFGEGENGTANEACKAFDILRKTTSSYLTELRDRVFSHTIAQANTLSKHVSKKALVVEAAASKSLKELKTERSKTWEAWKNYEKCNEERERLEAFDKPVGLSKVGDPYTACRVYEQQLVSLRATEVRYKKEMLAIYSEVRAEDGKRMEKTKALMVDQLQAQKAVLEHTLKFTDQAIQAVKALDPENDMNDYAVQRSILVSKKEAMDAGWSIDSGAVAAVSAVSTPKSHSPPPTTPTASHSTSSSASSAPVSTIALPGIIGFELPPPPRDSNLFARLYTQEMARAGVLFRPGKFLRTNWKEIYIVLSRNGFLHYFDVEGKHGHGIADVTLPLHDCSVGPTAASVSPYGIEISRPKEGIFSSSSISYIFRAHTTEERDQWMKDISQYTLKSHNEDVEKLHKELQGTPVHHGQTTPHANSQKATPRATALPAASPTSAAPAPASTPAHVAGTSPRPQSPIPLATPNAVAAPPAAAPSSTPLSVAHSAAPTPAAAVAAGDSVASASGLPSSAAATSTNSLNDISISSSSTSSASPSSAPPSFEPSDSLSTPPSDTSAAPSDTAAAAEANSTSPTLSSASSSSSSSSTSATAAEPAADNPSP